MKKTLCILLLILLSCLCACQSSARTAYTEASQATEPSFSDTTEASVAEPTETLLPEATPLFWRVSGNGFDGEFYLLGSIHVGLGHSYPDAITSAYASCDYLAVENDIIALENDLTAATQMLQVLVYTDGTSISEHIDAELYEEAKQVLTDFDYYNSMLDYYCPVFWSQLIDNLAILEGEFDSELGVDYHFLEEAKKDGTTILEIEDYMQTYRALASLSEETQTYLLRCSVDPETLASYDDSLRELYEAWLRGDESALTELLTGESEALSAEELACLEEYNKALLADRNEIMLDAAVRYLSEGKNVFYVVGLAHMLGEDGLVAALTEQGYTVEQVLFE